MQDHRNDYEHLDQSEALPRADPEAMGSGTAISERAELEGALSS